AKAYTQKMTARFGLSESSQVVEIASNDGYLLQYFYEQKIPVLGIEPTANTAEVAIAKGVNTITEFFGVPLAQTLAGKGTKAKLLLGNNVLAHVPDIVDFVGGMKILLAADGIITMEFPHLLQLVEKNQFDTIYHEHFSYLSFYTVKKIFEAAGLEMFDVEELPTHGGSLRIYAKHPENTSLKVEEAVAAMIEKEERTGITTLNYYNGFQQKAFKVKTDMLSFLLEQKIASKKVAGYGAAAKGNTLLNYCGIKADLIDFVVDANPHKQNKFLPGSHIPVVNEAFLKEAKPDFIIIFPWNLQTEITNQLAYIKDWGGKFVVPIPELQVF
ncbi:MAG: methyltransferase domain-containing protein, partial [Sphingobacteriaceae bacterium]